jgi:hypothetical protein
MVKKDVYLNPNGLNYWRRERVSWLRLWCLKLCAAIARAVNAIN